MVEQLDPQVAQTAADTSSSTPEGPESVDAGIAWFVRWLKP